LPISILITFAVTLRSVNKRDPAAHERVEHSIADKRKKFHAPQRQLDREGSGLQSLPDRKPGSRRIFPYNPSVNLTQSGLNMSPDHPSTRPKEARIGLRFKISSNWAYF
jgi:hypothetical protein